MDDKAMDARLSRIEMNLDKLAEAFVNLARVETRMDASDKRLSAFEAQQIDLTDRIVRVEQNVSRNGYSLRFAERLFWIIAAPVATTAVAYFSGAFQ